jgi:hypothetical protein
MGTGWGRSDKRTQTHINNTYGCRGLGAGLRPPPTGPKAVQRFAIRCSTKASISLTTQATLRSPIGTRFENLPAFSSRSICLRPSGMLYVSFSSSNVMSFRRPAWSALTGRFVGARSAAVKVRVACYSIWQSYQLDEAGQEIACIGDCLRVALAHRPYVWTDVSGRGDSGAWVMSDGQNGAQWLGVLIGGDGERSGVVPAHRILDHLRPTLVHSCRESNVRNC